MNWLFVLMIDSSGRQSNIRTKNNTTSSEIIESNDAQISKTNINLNSKGKCVAIRYAVGLVIAILLSKKQ